MDHKIIDAAELRKCIMHNFGFDVVYVAEKVDSDKAKEIIDRCTESHNDYDELWEQQARLLKWYDDSESRLRYFADCAYKELRDLIVHKWIFALERDELIGMGRALKRAYRYIGEMRIQLMPSVELNINDVVGLWCELHPDETPVYVDHGEGGNYSI